MRRSVLCLAALLACLGIARADQASHSAEIDAEITRQAKLHGVPEKLIRRVVVRESNYNPRARNHSFWGLMQISYPTAKSMGFHGSPSELLDPVVNLTYAVPYLANAFIIAGRREDAAIRLYASGYYATAKNHSLLDQLRTAESTPINPDDNILTATTRPVSDLLQAVVNGPQPVEAKAAAVATGGGDAGDGIAMAQGRHGLEPPRRWVKDGGVSLVAQGEQRPELVAAYIVATGGKAETATRHVARAHSTKLTQFASLDPVAPGDARAYAPSGQPSAESSPQSAITQATSGRSGEVGSAASATPGDEAGSQAADGRARTVGARRSSARHGATKVAADASAASPGEAADDKPARGRHRKATKSGQAIASAAGAEAASGTAH